MSEKKIRLVLDSNTIISGLLWKGNEYLLLGAIDNKNAELYISEEILLEIDRVLHYPRLEGYIKKAGLSIEELLQKILSLSRIVIGENRNVHVCRDPDDNKFIECAINANADYLISGDNDLLVIKVHENIKITTTREILKIL